MAATAQAPRRLPTLEEIEAEEARRHLAAYLRWIWPIVEPATPLVWGWHLDAICRHLEALASGQIRNLLITVPPRHTKSLLCSVAFPTWEWATRPATRFLFASYADDLSLEHAVLSRRVIESAKYQAAFGRAFALVSDQNVKSYYENDARGYRISTSVGGSGTGRGGDVLVVDDPHNLKERLSEAKRKGVLDWLDHVWSTRLNDPNTGRNLVIMQRCHMEDAAGHLLKRGDYVHLSLPTEYERTAWVSPIGWRDPRTAEGELLCPERFGTEAVLTARRNLGSYDYAAQHQQRPSPEGGGMFKRSWWKFYRELPPLRDFEQIIQSWDMAFKGTDSADFVAGGVWGRIGSRKYLLHRVNQQMNFPATVMAVRTVSALWPMCQEKLIEDKANGPAVISTLENEIGGIIAVDPQGGKLARAAAVSYTVEAGNVWLPHPDIAPWVEEYLGQFDAFPKGANDDEVDQTTQALARLCASDGGIAFLGPPAPKTDEDKQAEERAKREAAVEAMQAIVRRDGMYWPGGR